MQKVVCPYCGRVAKYVDSSVIYYGHSYGMAYLSSFGMKLPPIMPMPNRMTTSCRVDTAGKCRQEAWPKCFRSTP